MTVTTKELMQGFPPDWQTYLDNMSLEDRKVTLDNLARYERKAKREHNRLRKSWLNDFGEDLGPYKSTNEWQWEAYRREQAQSILTGEYAILGLDTSAALTKRDVRNAYRRQSRRLHPDAGGNDEAFKELHAAYRRVLASVPKE
jgi:DnaJ-class molecular chaperone